MWVFQLNLFTDSPNKYNFIRKHFFKLYYLEIERIFYGFKACLIDHSKKKIVPKLGVFGILKRLWLVNRFFYSKMYFKKCY